MNEQNPESINHTVLNRLIALYLEQEQAGHSMNREEILRWHPELADDLRSFFAHHDQMKGVNAPVADIKAPTIPPSQSGLDDPTIAPSESPSEARTIPPTAPTASKEVAIPPTAAPGEDATLPPKDVSDAPKNRSGEKVRYFGDYALLEEIARGGMGVVYKARQTKLNRLVALKMILTGQLAGDEDVKRFHAEAEAAANLDHPGIVPIHEIGEHDGQHYFSMAFVEGESLGAKVADGPLRPEKAANITRKISQAMAYAHDNGVVHRDLKPANVLLDKNGEPKITDFGLAKKLEAESHLTSTGQILGTPSYMPPEQAASETDKIGPLSDIYSLGAILYCLLTGRPPFQAASPMDTLLQVLDTDPLPPREMNAKIPHDLETICLKCLEKSPQNRYASASDLVEELGRFLAGKPILARPITRAHRAWRWCKRNPILASLSTAIAILLLVLGIAGPIVAVKQTRLAREQKTLADENKQLAEKERDARNDTEKQLRISTALRLVSESQRLGNEFPIQSVLLATEAVEATRQYAKAIHPLARQSLCDALTRVGGKPLIGHESHVLSVAISPDGRWLATGSYDKTARLWDLTSKEPAATSVVLRGHKSYVRSVAISPDGRWLATGSADKTARLWDLTSKDPAASSVVLRGHEGTVWSVAISPDGRWLATGSVDKTARLWDLTSKNPAASAVVLRGHESTVSSMAISPDGRWLATGSYDTMARLWDLTSKDPAATSVVLRGHEDAVTFVAFSPDSRWLATGSDDKTARLWDVDLDLLMARARRYAGRELTPRERSQHFLE